MQRFLVPPRPLVPQRKAGLALGLALKWPPVHRQEPAKQQASQLQVGGQQILPLEQLQEVLKQEQNLVWPPTVARR